MTHPRLKLAIAVIVLALIGVFVYSHVQATDTSATNPGTVANDTTPGGTDWVNPTNAASSDDSDATVAGSLNTSFSDYLKATNFGFSIPAGATIDGIVVKIEKMDTTLTDPVFDRDVLIIKGGTIGATDKATTTIWNTAQDTIVTYGSSSDLWGETWTADDINSSDFGVVINATLNGDGEPPAGAAAIDHITITVSYTEAVLSNRQPTVQIQTRVSLPNGRMIIK